MIAVSPLSYYGMFAVAAAAAAVAAEAASVVNLDSGCRGPEPTSGCNMQ